MRRLVLLIMYISLALVFVAGRHAHADEWLMMATGFNPTTEETEVILTATAETQDKCVYTLGFVLGGWYEAGLVGAVSRGYSVIDGVPIVSFWYLEDEWLVTLTCKRGLQET